MSVLNLGADVPSGINTVEKLAAWVGLLLHDLNRGYFYKETDDSEGSVPQVTAGIVEAADGTDRLIVRMAIPMDTGWRSESGQKLWQFADQIRDTAIPATFKAN